jgi:hypothetical protein
MPQMAESEYLDRMIECVDESVFYERIWKDGTFIAIRKDVESTYIGDNRDLVESSDVIIGVYPENNSIKAASITTFPAGPGTAIVRFGLTAKIGKSNDYILQFDSFEIALKELLKTKGFTRATNNAYQHPERIHEKTRLISGAINTCMTATRG